MGNKQETKKQHFVPRTYLRNFSFQKNNDFYLNAIPIDNCEETNIFESNIKDMCAENNLYTLIGDTEEDRQLLERLYSDSFESKYKSVYDVLTNDSIIEITREQRTDIIETVITMFYRTKKWINLVNDFTNQGLEKAYDLNIQFGNSSFTFEGKRISIDGKTINDLKREFKVNSRVSQVIKQLQFALKLVEIRRSDNINVFKIIDDGEFITSDNPVIIQNINGKRTIPFDVDNVFYLPISKKYLLSIFPREFPIVYNKIIRLNLSGAQGLKYINNFNSFQIHNSDKFVIASQDSLKMHIPQIKCLKIKDVE